MSLSFEKAVALAVNKSKNYTDEKIKSGNSGAYFDGLPHITLEMWDGTEDGIYPLTESESAFFQAAAEKKQDIVVFFYTSPLDGRYVAYAESEDMAEAGIPYAYGMDFTIVDRENERPYVRNTRLFFTHGTAGAVGMGDSWVCVVEQYKEYISASEVIHLADYGIDLATFVLSGEKSTVVHNTKGLWERISENRNFVFLSMIEGNSGYMTPSSILESKYGTVRAVSVDLNAISSSDSVIMVAAKIVFVEAEDSTIIYSDTEMIPMS